MSYEILTCPFCKETDFDALGLKLHLLNGWCEEFNGVTPPERNSQYPSQNDNGLPGDDRGFPTMEDEEDARAGNTTRKIP